MTTDWPREAPLMTTGLRRYYNREPAVDGLDLDVGPGEIHAVVGLNGAGKTTLMRMLLGMVRPDAGLITLLGHDVRRAPGSVWRQVGHLIEMPFSYPELTVRENVYVAARLHGLSAGAAGPAVGAVIAELELVRLAGRRARALSLGNRQRVGLACALVHHPRLLVLDEPTNALDPAGVVLVRTCLERLARRDGTSILISSHHLDELARIAHRISVIHRGRIVGSLDPDGVDLERQFFALVRTLEETVEKEDR